MFLFRNLGVIFSNKITLRIFIVKSLLNLCFFIVIFIFIVYVGVNLFSKPYIINDINKLPNSQTAVILGAGILKNGNLSPILVDRADTAIQLYNANKVKKILVTGDNSRLSYNEVNPVRLYLLKNNISDGDIFLDHAGFDTYSSMYRARDIFLADSMIIVTQSFHLPRAVFIARSLGLKAYGFSADHGHYKFSNYLREMPANVKAVFNIFFNREPKFLGEEIPLSGSGAETR